MRTKIILTIGPSSESPEILAKLAEKGFDIARMNFSHCTHEEFKSHVRNIKAVNKKYKTDIKILQDLQGPRIRVGNLPPEGKQLSLGEQIIFSTKKEKARDIIFVDNPTLHKDIKKGNLIYLSNGEMQLSVTAVKGCRIYAKVLREGILYSHKAINLPHTKLRISGLTKKDITDLKLALKEGVDYVAVSFVQTAKDMEQARRYVGNKVKLIAKIETALALENINGIFRASDGIMIARGDLGIEVPEEQVPFIQKNLIHQAIWHNKPSITATQILTSMINHPVPTRAEVSDIANAVFDGTDAIMLSDETASGKHPLHALEILRKVILQSERYLMRLNHL